MTPALAVEHVAVHFGGLVAISDLTFSVAAGEVVGLIGANGAGKTTAFNVITGFLPPTSGEVRYRGRTLRGLKPNHVTELGLVRTFQRTLVFQNHTVFENVLTGVHRRSSVGLIETMLALPRSRALERESRKQAQEILELVGISRLANVAALALSHGDQRLLGIALALAASPSMLLLDEPVCGMNPSETARVIQLLHKLHAQGLTILLVEHDMRMVMSVCDRVVVLNQGRVIAEGRPEEIQRNPDVIRAYLGESAKRA